MTGGIHPFKWVIPLQHMAKVKTVEMLWRNSAGRHELKCFYAKIDVDHLLKKPMIEHVEKYLDGLPIPGVIKNELMVYVIEMVSDALSWLVNMTREFEEINPLNDNYPEMFSYFIDNISWDNNGCVDVCTMLKSYVSNKETVDFDTWKLLCDYCMEEDIIRLARTIDWKTCRNFTNSPCCIYWYWIIHGNFPTKEMFSSDRQYSRFQESSWYKDDMVWTLLRIISLDEYCPSGVRAIKYFRSQLEDAGKFRKLYSDRNIIYSTPATIVYLFGQMEDGSWLEPIYMLPTLFVSLTKWPWVMFTDNWVEVLQGSNITRFHFLCLFDGVGMSKKYWSVKGLKEKNYEVLYNWTMYRPFQQIWTAFIHRFELDDEATFEGFGRVYIHQDIALCKIMFDSVGLCRRRLFLKTLRNLAESMVLRELSDRSYCSQFMENVLNTDEERKFFRRLVKN